MTSQDSITVRAAQPRDLESIVALGDLSWNAARWGPDHYKRALAGGSDRITLVAEDEGSGVIAFLIAQRVTDEWDLENIVVAKTARNRGTASALLRPLIVTARDSKAKRIFLEVRASNAAAIALYRKFGFQQDGRRTAYYSNPLEDALLFSLSIENSS